MINIKNPENKYRPAPFWSWNDKLEVEELRRQIREMHAAGQGGFFMHARGGLQTKYMSKEWMECINSCLDEAGKLGMEAYLYDENGWPSGFGDGLVNGLGEAYQLKYLRYEEKDLTECGTEKTIAYYTCDGKFISRDMPKNYQGKILRFYYEVNQFYVDNLDKKVVREFLNCIHEYYYKNIPAELLKHLRGIFTDEPQLSRTGIAWSFILEEEYQKMYGVNLLEDLPALYFDKPQSKVVRVRFWKLVSKLFTENFMKQIYDWCDERNWILTGHGLIEDLCGVNIWSNGDIMSIYPYFHIPGVDHLCRTAPSKVAAIQLLSAAHQAGRKQLMSESFALAGWNFNFSGMHWLFQQQLACGINFLCPHLSGYTLRGLRKRDYPASLAMHQPWWDDYKKVNDYFSRVGMLLAEGEEKVDLLVVHPLSTLHAVFNNQNDENLKYYINQFYDLSGKLSSSHVTYHYADEILFEELGSFDGKNIVIGKCHYDYVLIPELNNLSLKMAKALQEFEANGGKICKIADSSSNHDSLTVDGEVASLEMQKWFNDLPTFDDAVSAVNAVKATLGDIVKTYENNSETNDILSIRRYISDIGDGRSGIFYLISNSRYQDNCKCKISLAADGDYVELIDKETGKFSEILNVSKEDNRLVFDYNFGAGEGIMVFVSNRLDSHAGKVVLEDYDDLPCLKKLSTQMVLNSLGEGNVLTLDQCRYRVNNSEWITDEISVIHPRLIKKGEDCDLEIECNFFLEDDFDLNSELVLISETPEIFKYSLNGVEFIAEDSGYLFDKAFRKIKLPPILKKGVNTVGMKCRYYQSEETKANYRKAMIFESEYNKLTYDTEIESFYLLGNFAVNQQGKKEELPRGAERLEGNFTVGKSLIGKVVDVADLVVSGMPFFSGKMKFVSNFELNMQEVSQVRFLRFKGVGANSYRITINGKEAGFVYMDKYVVNVADCIQAGVNTLEIEVTTSLRNTLGPHHLAEGESYAVHTLSFSKEGCSSAWVMPEHNPDYVFVKLGLIELELI